MTSLGQIPQADPPHSSASLACHWKGVPIVPMVVIVQVIVIYSVLALTFGAHYFRDRRPKKQPNALKHLQNWGVGEKPEQLAS